MGSWIKASFGGKKVVLTSFKYMQRDGLSEHNKDIRLEFSDGSYQDYQLKRDRSLQVLTLKVPVTTTFVKLGVRSVWAKVNNGANEIQYFGYVGVNCGAGEHLYSGRRLLQNVLTKQDDATLEQKVADLLVQNAMLKSLVQRMCSKLFADEECELSL